MNDYFAADVMVTRLACWELSLKWAERSGVFGLWFMTGSTLSRSIMHDRDPATFTPGHPDCEDE